MNTQLSHFINFNNRSYKEFCLLFLFFIINNNLFSQTTYHYDPLNRLTQVEQADGTIIEYCYDDVGNMTCYEIESTAVLPDLGISQVNLSTTSIGAGASLFINAINTNYTAANAAGHYVQVYLSNEDNILHTQFITELKANSSDTIHSQILIDEDIAAGDYQLLVCTDAYGALVTEADETNNCVAISISITNCGVTNMTFSNIQETCFQSNGQVTISTTGNAAPYTYQWNTNPVQLTASIQNLSAGTYTVTVTNVNGCETIASTSLENISDQPSAGFTFVKDTLELSFTNTSLDANHYTWNFGDGQFSNLQNPIHNYALSGSYEVCLTVENNCGTDIFCQSLYVDTPSIDEEINNNNADNDAPYWTKRYSSFINPITSGADITATTDGNLFFAYANSGSNIIFSKVTKTGLPIWEQSLFSEFHNASGIELLQVLPADEGGVYCLIHRNNYRFTLLKLDSEGNKVWYKFFHTPGNITRFLVSAITKVADGLVLGGWDYSSFKKEPSIMKIDFDGNEMWHTIMNDMSPPIWSSPSSNNGTNRPNKILALSNGELLVSVPMNSGDGGKEIGLIKLSATGTVIWNKMYRAEGDIICYDLVEYNGSYILMGNQDNNQAYLLSITPNGLINFTKKYTISNALTTFLKDDVLQVFSGLFQYKIDATTGETIDAYEWDTKYGGRIKALANGDYAVSRSDYMSVIDSTGLGVCGRSVTPISSEDFTTTVIDIPTTNTSSSITIGDYAHSVFYDLDFSITDYCIAVPSAAPLSLVLKDTVQTDFRKVVSSHQNEDGKTYFLLLSDNSYVILAYDASGNVLFNQQILDIDGAVPRDITVANDGKILVTGDINRDETQGVDFFVAYLSSLGQVLWTKTFGGSEDDFFRDAVFDHNNNMILVGNSNSFGTEWESVICKINTSGDIQWLKTFNNTATFYNNISKIKLLKDNHYLLIGQFGSNTNASVFKMNMNGTIIWSKEFNISGSDGPYTPEFYDAHEKEGKIYLCGTHGISNATSRLNITRLSSNGNLDWSKDFDSTYDKYTGMAIGEINEQLICIYEDELNGLKGLGTTSLDFSGNFIAAKKYENSLEYNLETANVANNLILGGNIEVIGHKDGFIFILDENDDFPCQQIAPSFSAIPITLTSTDGILDSENESFAVQNINLNTSDKYYEITAPCDPICNLELSVADISNETCASSNGYVHLVATDNVGVTIFRWSHGITGQNADQLPSGHYVVSVTDQQGCEVIQSFDIDHQGETPEADFSYSISDNKVILTNTSTSATDYEWDFSDGSSSIEFSPTHSFSTDGTYNVCLNATNDCGTNTICQSIMIDCVQTYFRDQDGDSYGNDAISINTCLPPIGYVLDNTDCNDNNSHLNPGIPNTCCSDLIIDHLEYDGTRIYFDVINQGNISTSNTFIIQAYWSNSTTVYEQAAGGVSISQGLSPNETKSYSWANNNTQNKSYLIVILDNANAIDECSESNNIGILNVQALAIQQFTFAATPLGNHIQLQWSLEDEEKLIRYHIQRSNDQVIFEHIGTVDVLHKLPTTPYSFLDQHITANQWYYYRLQLEEKDGSLNYSELKAAKVSEADEIKLYPNPTTQNITIEWTEIPSSTTKIIIFDILGQEVFNRDFDIMHSTMQLDVSFLVDGLYCLELKNGNNQWEANFVLMR